VINLPTVSSKYSEHCRSGASRKSVGAERSGEPTLQKNNEAERGAGGRGAGTERGAGLQK